MHARINLDQVYGTLADVAPFDFTLTVDGADFQLQRLSNAQLNKLSLDNSAEFIASLFVVPPPELDDVQRRMMVAQAITTAYGEYFKKKLAISRQAIAAQLIPGAQPAGATASS